MRAIIALRHLRRMRGNSCCKIAVALKIPLSRSKRDNDCYQQLALAPEIWRCDVMSQSIGATNPLACQ